MPTEITYSVLTSDMPALPIKPKGRWVLGRQGQTVEEKWLVNERPYGRRIISECEDFLQLLSKLENNLQPAATGPVGKIEIRDEVSKGFFHRNVLISLGGVMSSYESEGTLSLSMYRYDSNLHPVYYVQMHDQPSGKAKGFDLLWHTKGNPSRKGNYKWDGVNLRPESGHGLERHLPENLIQKTSALIMTVDKIIDDMLTRAGQNPGAKPAVTSDLG